MPFKSTKVNLLREMQIEHGLLGYLLPESCAAIGFVDSLLQDIKFYSPGILCCYRESTLDCIRESPCKEGIDRLIVWVGDTASSWTLYI
jgi:hypothetical protein